MKEFVKLQNTFIRTSTIQEVKFEHYLSYGHEKWEIVLYHFETSASRYQYRQSEYDAFKRDSDALENTLLELDPAPKPKKTSKKKQESATDN